MYSIKKKIEQADAAYQQAWSDLVKIINASPDHTIKLAKPLRTEEFSHAYGEWECEKKEFVTAMSRPEDSGSVILEGGPNWYEDEELPRDLDIIKPTTPLSDKAIRLLWHIASTSN